MPVTATSDAHAIDVQHFTVAECPGHAPESVSAALHVSLANTSGVTASL